MRVGWHIGDPLNTFFVCILSQHQVADCEDLMAYTGPQEGSESWLINFGFANLDPIKIRSGFAAGA